MRLVWLMAFGALGAAARYGLNNSVQGWLNERDNWIASGLGATFPLGTLIINVTGSFLLAFLAGLVTRGALKPDLQIILGTGFLGAYTTFSTFELESERLVTAAQWLHASVYIGGNLILGFLAIPLGRAAAIYLTGGVKP